jgi:REP element-mobilizing transposase RayT
MGNFHKSSHTHNERWDGRHRFEHWYRDNTVYFITARCRDRFHAFESEQAKAIFWDRFEHHTAAHGFKPWITTLIGNHYHTIGYLKEGKGLGKMIQKIHGSVAKLVNDVLPERHLPFWRNSLGHDYWMDVCAMKFNAAERIATRSHSVGDTGSAMIRVSIRIRAFALTLNAGSSGRWN